ncbi:uncharacterized protein LOC115210393 isoform X9 [Octopus sinensis]|uniref:Uncharacterized protein LOC115210393 isoform X9 n=1 Tax=Octopus sinensis TaxID=2607531 RepID=A0A7E6ESH2_9MOLL|nr:uncharacterized protein LOC115210393 isoform X9 [Octopus sinensis]
MLKWTNTIESSKSLSPKKGSVIVMKGKVKKSSPRRENGTPSKPSLKTTPAPVAGKPTSLPQNQNLTDPNRNQTPESKTEHTLASNKGQTTNQSNKPQPIQTGLVKDPVTGPRGNLNGSSTPLPDNHLYQQNQGTPTNTSPQPQIPLSDNVPQNIPQSQSPQSNPDFYNSSPQRMASPSSPPQRPSSPPHPKLVSQTLTRDAYPSPKHQAPSQPYSSSLQTPHSHTNSPSPKHTNLNTTSHQPQYSSHASSVHHGQKPSGSPRQNPVPYQQSDQYYPHEAEREATFQQEQYDQHMYDAEYNQPDNYYDNSPQQSHGHRRPSIPNDHGQIHGRQSPHPAQNYRNSGSNQGSGGYPPSANDFYRTESPQRASDLDNSPYTHQSNQNAAMQHSPGSHRSRSRTRKGSTSPRNVNNQDYIPEHDGYGRDMAPAVDQRYPPEYYDTPMQEQQDPYAYAEDLPMSQPSANVTNSPRVPGTQSPRSQIPSSPGRHMQHSPTSNMPSSTKAQYTENKHRRTPSPQMGTQFMGTSHSPHQQKINSNQNMRGLDQKPTNYNTQGHSPYSPTKMEQYSPDDYGSYPMQNGNNQFEGYSPNVPQMGTQHLQGHYSAQHQQGSHMTAYSSEYNNQDQRHNFRRNSYSSSSARAGPQGHYNPENVDTSFQVKAPLKHVDSNTPTKRAPRSPKTPLALPLGAKQPPSPSTVARALKVDMREKTPTKNQQYPLTTQAKPMLPPIPKKEIFVTFPDKQMTKHFIDPNMAMMDLLVQLAASKRLNPSAHVLVAVSERDNEPIDYKANQPVGLVESHRVNLLPKEQCKTPPYAVGTGNDNKMDKPLPFEDINLPPGKISPDKVYEIYQPGPNLISPNQMTYRLTINLPHAQKVVRRMSANHPLHELHQSVCEEKNLDPNVFVLQRPDKPGSVINLKYTLQELGLQQHELNLVHKASTDHYMSVPDLSPTSWIADPTKSSQSQGPSKNYIHMPPPKDTRRKKGFFSFLKKDKKDKSRSLSPTSFSELADTIENWMTSFFSGNSGKQRPTSMFSPVTESLENYMKKPKKSTKSKPAPPPPTSTMPGGVANPVQSHVSNTLPQPGSSSSQGETFQNTGHTLGYSNQPAYDSRSSSQSSGRIEPTSAHGCHITPPSPDARQFSPSQSPLNVKQQPQFHSHPDLPSQFEVNKIGTDSITYMESNNNRHIKSKSVNIAEIHAAPYSKSDVDISKTVPGLHLQKTANDMYASPYKKRKPAPPPPPVVAEELKSDMGLFIEHTNNITAEQAKNFRPTTPVHNLGNPDGSQSPRPRLTTGNELTEGTAIYLGKHRNSIASATDDDFSTTDTVTSNISMGETLSPKSFENGKMRRPSISSEGSFTTVGMSEDYNINGIHDQLPNGDTHIEEPRMIPEIVETVETGVPYGMESFVPDMNHVVENEVETHEVNGIEEEIVMSVSQDNASRPMLESSPSLELSRSSSAAELAQYMNSPKEELVLTKEDRKSLDYRGSPMIENQRKQEVKEESKKLSPSNEKRSPKIRLDGYTLSIDSESDTIDSESTQDDSIPLAAQTNLKKQIERWQKQLQEHLNDNSGLYTAQEQEKLREKVDQWNKQLKELNVTDSSGFRLLEQKVMKQQIELWQRKLSAKERQSDGAKKYKEQEIEFLKKQVQVWKQKIKVIEKTSSLYTIEEREVLQEQIDLWQNQLDKKGCDTDSSTKEQNLLRHQIEVWKKNLKDKKFAGHSFSAQEQDILRRQLIVWQKQLHWYKDGDSSSQREILKEQVNVWHSQLQDVQSHQDKDSKVEQDILEQQIELWQNKMNEKNSGSEALVMKQIDIWKKQTRDNQNPDNGFLVIEQQLLEREIQLWNKKLNGNDIESETFLAEEMDVLCDKIDLYQKKLQKNNETNSTMEPIEQDLLKLQVDLWQQKLAAMQERKESLQKYNEEQQNILKFQIELWQDKLAHQNIDINFRGTELKGSELLAKEIDIWQRWLDVKREKKETRIKFKLLNEELQKDQIRLWQDHLDIIKNNTLGYTEEEREILMQQIELWQRGLVENKDKKIIHLAAEQDILKKYIDLWYTKMKRNSDTSIGEEESDVREQISIWKKQLKLFNVEETLLPHSVQQDIINQQIMVWQKKREKCQTEKDTDELGKIESEILQQQIELWQNDLLDYEKSQNQNENVPQKQIKLLQRKLSKTDKDVNPEITAQENAIVNRQIDFYTKMSSLDEGYNAEYITDEQEILEKQINLARLKLSQTDGSSYYSETEYDLLQKQVNLWHRQLIAIQHRLDIRKKLVVQEQNLLKEQISLWEAKLKTHLGPSSHTEEQKAMQEQLEIWQQQLEDHKTSILNKGSNVKEDPLADKMAQMLKSQEEIIQSFQEGLKHLPENLKNQVRSSPSSPQTKVRSSKGILPPPPELPQRPISPKEIKPQIKPITNFPPPPETFSDKSQKQKENSKTKSSSNSVPPVPPKPATPPPKLPFTVNLKKVGPPKENSPPVKTEVNFFRKQNDTEDSGVVRAVPAMVVLKPPSVAPKPKRKLPEPELTPREQLLMEIKNSSRGNLKGVKLKDTNWSKDSQS